MISNSFPPPKFYLWCILPLQISIVNKVIYWLVIGWFIVSKPKNYQYTSNQLPIHQTKATLSYTNKASGGSFERGAVTAGVVFLYNCTYHLTVSVSGGAGVGGTYEKGIVISHDTEKSWYKGW